MHWNESKDILMMREVAALGVLVQRSGSKERGNLWQQVADALNEHEEFCVTARGVRERLFGQMKKHRTKMNKDKKRTGEGGDEVTEYEVLIEELMQLSDDTDARCDQESNEKETKKDEDRKKALDIRNQALERVGDTRKRHANSGDENPSCSKTPRRSSSDTLNFLRERIEADKENKILEREEKAEERRQAHNQQMLLQQQFNAILNQQTQMLKLFMDKLTQGQ